MEELTKYRVILSGSIMPGYDRSQVLQGLADIFHSNTETMERLLQGESVPLKKEYQQHQAKRICDKVREAGAHCILEKIPEPEISLTEDNLSEQIVLQKCLRCQNLLDEGWLKCPVCGLAIVGVVADKPARFEKGNADESLAKNESTAPNPSPKYFQMLMERYVDTNTTYYRDQFHKFGDPKNPIFKISWHWPAFFFFFFWALYRKMWIWAGIHMLVGMGLMVWLNPGPSYLGWVLLWPIIANYLYFRSVAAVAVLAENQPASEQKLLDKGGVSKAAVWGGVLIALISTITVSNYVTKKFVAEYGDHIQDVLPGSGSQTRGDGSIVQDIPSKNSQLARTSRTLSTLATALKILLVTEDSQQNRQAISRFIDQLSAGKVSDGWGQGIRIEQQINQYVLMSSGPDLLFGTDDDIFQPIKSP